MNIEQGIAIMLLATATLIILIIVLRSKRIKPSDWPGDNNVTSAKRVQQDARELMTQLDQLAGDIERRMEKGISQLQDLLAQAHEKNRQLRPENDLSQTETKTKKPADEIRRLSEQGMSSVEISRRLNRPVGEIELTLRLQHSET